MLGVCLVLSPVDGALAPRLPGAGAGLLPRDCPGAGPGPRWQLPRGLPAVLLLPVAALRMPPSALVASRWGDGPVGEQTEPTQQRRSSLGVGTAGYALGTRPAWCLVFRQTSPSLAVRVFCGWEPCGCVGNAGEMHDGRRSDWFTR